MIKVSHEPQNPVRLHKKVMQTISTKKCVPFPSPEKTLTN